MSAFPTESDLLRLNERVAKLLLQPSGVRDPKMLRAILLGVRISRSAGGPRRDAFLRSAALLHQIVSQRPFRGANGATGLGAALLYLSRHGFRVAFGSGQATTIVRGVADGTMSQDRIASMFRMLAKQAPVPPSRPRVGSRA